MIFSPQGFDAFILTAIRKEGFPKEAFSGSPSTLRALNDSDSSFADGGTLTASISIQKCSA